MAAQLRALDLDVPATNFELMAHAQCSLSAELAVSSQHSIVQERCNFLYGETEGYVQRTRVKAHRSLLAHLRGGTAPLQIETGRYVFLPGEERKM